MSFFPFFSYPSLFFLSYCSTLYLIRYWAGGLRWNKLISHRVSHALWVSLSLACLIVLLWLPQPYMRASSTCAHLRILLASAPHVHALCRCRSCVALCEYVNSLCVCPSTCEWVCDTTCVCWHIPAGYSQSFYFFVPRCMHTYFHVCIGGCVCVCAFSMCVYYQASTSVLESPREYLSPGVTVSW